jgi:hypothetical protein
MNTETFLCIVEKVRPKIESNSIKNSRSDTISTEEKVATTLRFLVTRDSYQSLKFSFRISPQSISIFIPEVCATIYESLRDEYLKIPSNENEWNDIAIKFLEMWNFPICFGSLDGKHVNI